MEQSTPHPEQPEARTRMDPVALASVITTGVLGLGGLATGGWQASKAREHEQRMAREAEQSKRREQAEATRLALGRWCYRLAPLLDQKSEGLVRAVVRDEDLSARVLVYADRRVRSALAALDATLTSELDTVLHWLHSCRREAAAAYEAEDWERMAAMRASEKDYLEDLGPMLEEVRQALTRVQSALAAAEASGSAPSRDAE